MKTFFVTYRKSGQSTRHTRAVEAATLRQAIDQIIVERATHGETITIMWVS